MTKPERYFVGPVLRDKLRTVVAYVDAQPDATAAAPSPQGGPPKITQPRIATFRVGTFGTSAWSMNQDNTVTLTNVSSAGQTVLARNIFANIGTASSSRNCGIARDGDTWYLIAAECG